MTEDKFETKQLHEAKNRSNSTHQTTFGAFKNSDHIAERFALSDEAYHQFDNWYLTRTLNFAVRWHWWSLY